MVLCKKESSCADEEACFQNIDRLLLQRKRIFVPPRPRCHKILLSTDYGND